MENTQLTTKIEVSSLNKIISYCRKGGVCILKTPFSEIIFDNFRDFITFEKRQDIKDFIGLTLEDLLIKARPSYQKRYGVVLDGKFISLIDFDFTNFTKSIYSSKDEPINEFGLHVFNDLVFEICRYEHGYYVYTKKLELIPKNKHWLSLGIETNRPF
jgi:hypothetical protein